MGHDYDSTISQLRMGRLDYGIIFNTGELRYDCSAPTEFFAEHEPAKIGAISGAFSGVGIASRIGRSDAIWCSVIAKSSAEFVGARWPIVGDGGGKDGLGSRLIAIRETDGCPVRFSSRPCSEFLKRLRLRPKRCAASGRHDRARPGQPRLSGCPGVDRRV